MTALNRYLEGCVEKNMFVTMAYALFDARKRQLSFTNAGHPAPLLLRAGAPGPVELPQSSFPLAVFTEAEFETSTVQLEPGDLFVMYTDGLTDARNVRQEHFGKQTVMTHLTKHRQAAAGEIVRGLLAEVEQFSDGTEPYDDMTLIALKVFDERDGAETDLVALSKR